jgi:hypothetical protein
MTPIDLLDAGLAQIFNLQKRRNIYEAQRKKGMPLHEMKSNKNKIYFFSFIYRMK